MLMTYTGSAPMEGSDGNVHAVVWSIARGADPDESTVVSFQLVATGDELVDTDDGRLRVKNGHLVLTPQHPA